MKVDKAWKISTGVGIKIAVLDSGVDLLHPDLKNNLLKGFDATGKNSKGAHRTNSNDAHGTACAGIIAAENNSIGTRGVAFNSKVIPVRVIHAKTNGGWYTTNKILSTLPTLNTIYK